MSKACYRPPGRRCPQGALPMRTGNTPFPLKINKFVRPRLLPVIFHNFPGENLNNFKTLTIHLLI